MDWFTFVHMEPTPKKKRKKSRSLYFRNERLWTDVANAAKSLKWSINQFIEDTVQDRTDNMKLPRG